MSYFRNPRIIIILTDLKIRNKLINALKNDYTNRISQSDLSSGNRCVNKYIKIKKREGCILKKWVCAVCSYVYDEAQGDPDRGIAPGTKWEEIPGDWACPVCGATKSAFEEDRESIQSAPSVHSSVEDDHDEMRELSFGEMSALCSNLSKGCSKQYRTQEAELFKQLAEFYHKNTATFDENQLCDIVSLIQQDLKSGYPQANSTASAAGDRGALRALVWGEKVSKILKSLLGKYEKKSDALLEGTRVFVCDICGFVYVGNELPEVCPVCKVPNIKFSEIKKEAI